ncbi:heterokaryon incompatibility protein-domain-containing protein [Xylariaceae sp. FL1019]|nr:heterokaryon incompatibility protein-domain-containing protein [Xylariaceae sp. FL1019]
MRLLNTTTFRLETFLGDWIPRYAILSHTWESDELRWKAKGGAKKVARSVKIARRHGYKYIWIDTCCIDKSSSAELSEAINSMFEWYKNAQVCYVYLSDVQSPRNWKDVALRRSKWFKRGWTELIAPRKVIFFGTTWKKLGTRARMARKIQHITRVDMDVLLRATRIHRFRPGISQSLKRHSIHSKMLWAAGRSTARPEDRAYSLMGLFSVNMPLLYGEGKSKAFRRLQEEILKSSNDQSILLFYIRKGGTTLNPCVVGRLSPPSRYRKAQLTEFRPTTLHEMTKLPGALVPWYTAWLMLQQSKQQMGIGSRHDFAGATSYILETPFTVLR